MDLWVVKYASRRYRIGDFSDDSSVRGARIRGRFDLSGECRPKGAVGSNRMGGGRGDQAIWSRSNERAGDRVGARADKPR